MTLDEFFTTAAAQSYAPPVLVARAAPYSLGTHSHSFDAFAYITEGEITLVLDNNTHTYAVGETFQLAANTPHGEHSLDKGVSYYAARREA